MWHRGPNPHVNYEPSITGGPQEAEKKPNNPPEVTGQLAPASLERTNDYLHARGRYCTMNEWKRDHLVAELGGMIQEAAPQVLERFLWHLFMIHDDYGTRVGEYIGKTADDVRHLEPLPSQRFTDDETRCLENLGSNATEGRRPWCAAASRTGPGASASLPRSWRGQGMSVTSSASSGGRDAGGGACVPWVQGTPPRL